MTRKKKKKRRAACFSLRLAASRERWRAKSAMHYPAITGAIYILPSITDTYYSPPAVQRLPHNFLKAAPYILIQQQLLCKSGKQEHNAEATEGNQHHHFSDRRRVMSLSCQRVPGQRDRGTIWGPTPCLCYRFVHRNIRCVKMTTFSVSSYLQEFFFCFFSPSLSCYL